jgi:hypothetical protein
MNHPRLLGHRHLVALAATALILAACETAPPTDTTPPGPVTSLTAVASDAAVTLTWTDPTATDLSVIRINRTPGGTTAEVDAGDETFAASGLTNGTEYSFSLVAVDAAGNASTAVVATATPPGTSASCANPVDLLDADVDGGVTLVSGTCYRVSSAITVSGGTLTIPSDVVVEFTDTGWLTVAVGAALAANGTAGAPVIFRGTEAIEGFWRGIRIQSESLSNVLNHVVVRDAGASAWTGNGNHVAALFMFEGRAAITNSTFTNNAGTGIQAYGNATLAAFSDNLFYANDVPMWLHPDRVGELDDTSAFSQGGVENDGQYVLVTFGNNDAVTSAQTWPALEVPYRVTDRTNIDAPLTIAAGARLEFEQDVELIVDDAGSLTLAGTESNRVDLVGVEELNGYWIGVLIQTASGSNVFSYATISNGGSTDGAGIHVANVEVLNGTLDLEGSVEVTNSGGFGLYVDTGTLTGCAVLSGSGNVSGNFGAEDSSIDCL